MTQRIREALDAYEKARDYHLELQGLWNEGCTKPGIDLIQYNNRTEPMTRMAVCARRMVERSIEEMLPGILERELRRAKSDAESKRQALVATFEQFTAEDAEIGGAQ